MLGKEGREKTESSRERMQGRERSCLPSLITRAGTRKPLKEARQAPGRLTQSQTQMEISTPQLAGPLVAATPRCAMAWEAEMAVVPHGLTAVLPNVTR